MQTSSHQDPFFLAALRSLRTTEYASERPSCLRFLRSFGGHRHDDPGSPNRNAVVVPWDADPESGP